MDHTGQRLPIFHHLLSFTTIMLLMLGSMSVRRATVRSGVGSVAQAFSTSSVSRQSSGRQNHRRRTQFPGGAPLDAKSKRTEVSRAVETTKPAKETSDSKSNKDNNVNNPMLLNLSTITAPELTTIVTAWGFPKYRATQIHNWIRQNGVTDVSQMSNLPKTLRTLLTQHTQSSALQLLTEQVSSDGTRKRAYQCHDGNILESVLMPYDDGRRTACISSQAGCAQGCVFCATGQMGLARQLTADEIVEQVARFAADLQQEAKEQQNNHGNSKESSSLIRSHDHSDLSTTRPPPRLSNIVFMGMGEPLANYKNVAEAIRRISSEHGIGGRKITVSTVGIVPKIRTLMYDKSLPQVRLAVSLHCATDDDRTALLPANRRNGGLAVLMDTLKEYVDTTGRRLTLEWALIAGQNDNVETARKLGRLVTQKHQIRPDMVHVNVIPLNPTDEYDGKPSRKADVQAFADALSVFGISCTPRVRRGIDIDAGCGQLTSALRQKQKDAMAKNTSRTNSSGESSLLSTTKEEPTLHDFVAQTSSSSPIVGVYEDEDDDSDDDDFPEEDDNDDTAVVSASFVLDDAVVDLDNEADEHDYVDPVYAVHSDEQAEADRLVALVKGTTVDLSQFKDIEK